MTNSIDKKTGKPLRAFVIPVLDYSPASEYNILTLLDDLNTIEGEAVVVFNGTQIGEELKDHPRITRYAIMKQNVGVARAWNIGIHMSEAETIHIVNADSHVTLSAVEALEHGLSHLENALCVGPQGAFVDFNACKDYFYFDKGSFDKPVQVDAVSGFFFAINQHLMHLHGIEFENSFTPCYYEEWDLGLQAKKAGLACWIVPTAAYDHHWSGTIRALRTIPYMGREETAGEVFERNRQMFKAKWFAGEAGLLLGSRYKEYLNQQMREEMEHGHPDRSEQYLDLLVKAYPDDEEVRSVARYMQLLLAKHRHTSNGGGC